MTEVMSPSALDQVTRKSKPTVVPSLSVAEYIHTATGSGDRGRDSPSPGSRSTLSASPSMCSGVSVTAATRGRPRSWRVQAATALGSSVFASSACARNVPLAGTRGGTFELVQPVRIAVQVVSPMRANARFGHAVLTESASGSWTGRRYVCCGPSARIPPNAVINMVAPTGVDPVTSRFSVVRSTN